MQLVIRHLSFDVPLSFSEIAAFRGAIANLVGYEHDLFHQHEQDKGYHYRYPLIQYKRLHQQAAITGLGKGAETLQLLSDRLPAPIKLGNRSITLDANKDLLRLLLLDLRPKPEVYTISKWLALNPENYQLYQQADGLKEQVGILEKVLASNIIAFASGIGWDIPQPFKVFILSLDDSYPIVYKNTTLMGFSIKFKTDIFLPNYIGLGKGASRGFGIVKEVRKSKKAKL